MDETTFYNVYHQTISALWSSQSFNMALTQVLVGKEDPTTICEVIAKIAHTQAKVAVRRLKLEK